MTFQNGLSRGSYEVVLEDVKAHLCDQATKYARFLTLVEILLAGDCSHLVEETILHLAEVLKAYPSILYKLNHILPPGIRIEFNVKRSPITSLVLKTPNASRLVFLDPRHRLHNISASSLCDILVNRTFGDLIYDAIHGVIDPALQDCLAQLSQDILDCPKTIKAHRKVVFHFLRHCGGVPPSLLLYDLRQLDPFTFTSISDVYHGMLGRFRVIIKKPKISNGNLKNFEVLREAIICRQFCHPNIIDFFGVNISGTDQLYSIVTPLMKNGNVMEFVYRHPNVNRLTLVWQIMKGLEYLHTFEPPIAHRAIKGSNILMNDSFACCLSDFGLSFIPEQSQQSHDYAISALAWMAPEVLLPPELGRIDLLKVDIFALAITILEIYLGQPPVNPTDLAALYMARVEGKEEIPLPPPCPYEFPHFLCDLVEMMLAHDPRQRPTARLICQGFEDNVIFSKEVDVPSEISQISVEGWDDHSEYNATREVVQRWVVTERVRIRNSTYTSRGRKIADPGVMTARIPRFKSYNASIHHSSPISPLFSSDTMQGPPTPPPDFGPVVNSHTRLPWTHNTGKRAKSRSRTPPVARSEPPNTQSLRGSQTPPQYPRDPTSLLTPKYLRKPGRLTIPLQDPDYSLGENASSILHTSNLPSPQTPEPNQWSNEC